MGLVSDYNTCAAWHGTLVSICHKTSIDEAIGLTIKPCSISKSKISYMNDRVGDGDACQAGTAIECVAADCGNGVGDGDARQAGTARVFASRFVSVICMLKGRKMPRRNL